MSKRRARRNAKRRRQRRMVPALAWMAGFRIQSLPASETEDGVPVLGLRISFPEWASSLQIGKYIRHWHTKLDAHHRQLGGSGLKMRRMS